METFAWQRKQLFLLFVLAFSVKTLESSKMKLTGKITVPSLKEGISLAKDSHLIVKLEDTSRLDAAAILLGKQVQLLPEGTKLGPNAEPLNYTIVCDKPKNIPSGISVSAVLNVGWEASGDEWLRKGDFFTDTTHDVNIGQTDPIVTDIELVPYLL